MVQVNNSLRIEAPIQNVVQTTSDDDVSSEKLLYVIMLMLYLKNEDHFKKSESSIADHARSLMDDYNDLTVEIKKLNETLKTLVPDFKSQINPADVEKLLAQESLYDEVKKKLYAAQADQEMIRGKESSTVKISLGSFEEMWRNFVNTMSAGASSLDNLIYNSNNKK